MEIVVDIRNLSSWFGENQVLRDIRMEIAKNSVTSVMGPSGCGRLFASTAQYLRELFIEGS